MVGDPAVVAEQAPRGAAGRRPARAQRHLLAAAHGCAVGRYPGALLSAHDLRQPLAEGGVWDRLLDAVSQAYDGDNQMIDSSSIRVHQHAANTQKKMTGPVAWVARGAA